MKDREEKISVFGRMKPGQDLIIAGEIGLSGTSCAAKQGELKLLQHFSASFVKRCQNLYETGGFVPPPGFFYQAEAASWCLPGEGGVMTALWDYFEAFGLGFELELRRIPVFQETVEVCEVFDMNPYRLHSLGCAILTADSGTAAVRCLESMGRTGVIIGRTKSSVGREIHNGDICSFLDRPKPDEIYKIQLAGGTK